MIDSRVIKCFENFFNSYFFNAYQNIYFVGNQIYTAYMPTNLIVTESEHHIFLDFFGASPRFSKLEVHYAKTYKTKNFYTYLTHCNDDEDSSYAYRIRIENSQEVSFSGLCVYCNTNPEALEKKYPVAKTLIERYPTGWLGTPDSTNLDKIHLPISVDESSDNVVINDCLFVLKYDCQIRMKHVKLLICIQKNKELHHYEANLLALQKIFSMPNKVPFGITALPADASSDNFLVANQFCSLYSLPSVREADIQKFIEKNKTVILKSLGYKSFIPQKELFWQDGNDTDKESIIPDFLLQRQDNTYDILDLKLPLNRVKSITVGPSSRTQPRAEVRDGIAQLSTYDRYFKIQKNIDYAKSNGIEINPSALLYLIIGKTENFNHEKVESALCVFRFIRTGIPK